MNFQLAQMWMHAAVLGDEKGGGRVHSAFLLVRASRPDKTPRQEEEKSGLDDHSGAMGTLRRAYGRRVN